MAGVEPTNRRQRVEDALIQILKEDEFGNRIQYVWASDLTDIDPEISAHIAGKYLAKLEKDSPLSNGLIVERYRKRRCGASLWTVAEEA